MQLERDESSIRNLKPLAMLETNNAGPYDVVAIAEGVKFLSIILRMVLYLYLTIFTLRTRRRFWM
jgi:hypothetical protein